MTEAELVNSMQGFWLWSMKQQIRSDKIAMLEKDPKAKIIVVISNTLQDAFNNIEEVDGLKVFYSNMCLPNTVVLFKTNTPILYPISLELDK